MISFQTIQTLNQANSLQHFSDIRSHCRNQLFPILAVPTDVLRGDLVKLSYKAAKHGHELAIAPIQNGEYYKYKIASFTFSKGRILIKVRIPLKEIGVDWYNHELINIPFHFYENVCTIRHSPTYVASTRNQVVAIQGTQLSLCQPYEGIYYMSANFPCP